MKRFMARYVIKRDQNSLPERLTRYKSELNEEQFRVVTAPPKATLVVAGAGIGKTRAMTYRVAFLIEQGVSPQRILLATFTNRAAREMLRRVENLTGSQNVHRVWGGTFHRIANLILRRHGVSLGYDSNYSILDSEDARGLINICVDDAAIDTKAKRFPKAEVMQDIISFANNTDLPIENVIAGRYPYFEMLTAQIKRVDSIYQSRKHERNVMDYDDLLLNVKKLLVEKPEIADIYAEQFQHILVDEYQDTNKLQAEIIDLLAVKHRNVMVVGDDAQSIFAWRGAEFTNIYEFPKRYPETQVFKLETNYRSTPEILGLANVSIAHNRKQFPKMLTAVKRSRDSKPALVPCSDVEQQSAFVASRILELRDEGTSLEDIAVMYRSHYHSIELQLELSRRNIPYRVQSGVRFFEQAHIKDVIAYLRIVVNPRDELAWKRVLKMIPGVGNATANRVYEQIALSEPPVLAGSQLLPHGFPESESGLPITNVLRSSNALHASRVRSQPFRDFISMIELISSQENRDKPVPAAVSRSSNRPSSAVLRRHGSAASTVKAAGVNPRRSWRSASIASAITCTSSRRWRNAGTSTVSGSRLNSSSRSPASSRSSTAAMTRTSSAIGAARRATRTSPSRSTRARRRCSGADISLTPARNSVPPAARTSALDCERRSRSADFAG
jgi:hypothetical protein